ncbi:NAD-dependent epimerase/dehydratase [Luminiphilus syltensis NOR5-1B]|uniref:NAD-dependent epimerase/dehydratase n=1 Tax=Luminiphilus syltensis NOR5-1B TaxID=565045 RepID=B8KSY5_9GAMM|nr:NAD-dependent epimerase/dehydratase family protein [Luminiphilus syltensis]EED36458.1 NAD-dependent epimerase/dehydratase [Luminiphilus syltensis NOR5-1B]
MMTDAPPGPSKTALVTGAAGFIGANVSAALLDRGYSVIGVDNLNDYYDVALKQYRLDGLTGRPGFSFNTLDLANQPAVDEVFEAHPIDLVVHLAAQAGVRYSLQNPDAYIRSNVLGFQSIVENCRYHQPEHLVFASSSSVYGNNNAEWFSETDNTDTPVSLYAATKKSNELVGHSYAKLYGIAMTGLRFFTVYGPAGRPDMAYFDFTRAILENEPIRVFNRGQLMRDFTYIDDILAGVIAACEAPPKDQDVPFRILNLGNNEPVALGYFIETLEQLLGKEAIKEYVDMQPGDVYKTAANIDAARHLLHYHPTTRIEEGLGKFVDWYRAYYE